MWQVWVHRMTRATPPSPPPAGRMVWRVVAFLLCFSALLLLVSTRFLVPALEAKKEAMATLRHAPHPGTQESRTLSVLSADSSLVLAVVLFTLVAGLLLTFRIGRFFRPRPTGPRVVTEHVDAWAESAKRMDASKLDDESEN